MLAPVLWLLLYITRAACYDERIFETASFLEKEVQKYFIKRGENITLLCPGVSENMLITDLDWLKVDGQRNVAHYENKTGITTWTKQDPRISLVENFGLNFAMAMASDSGEYICIYNGRHVPENVIKLVVQDVPDPPGKPLFVSFTSRSVKFSWPPSRNPNASPITHYIVNMRIGEDTPWMDDMLTLTNRTVHEVTGLLPFTVYSFRVMAVNAMGASIPSIESFYMVTLRELPTGIPEIISAEHRSSTTLYVKWKIPPDGKIFGEFLGYLLTFREMGMRTDNNKTEVYICNPKANHHLIGRLKAYTQYCISLQALNPEGAGPASSVFGITDEGAPEEPLNLTVLEVKSREIQLGWIEPERPNGIITGYSVYYIYNNFTDVKSFDWDLGYFIYYNLTGLKPDSEYTIYVKAHTSKDMGLSSIPVETQTDIEGPSPPRILNLSCQVNDGIFIQWERPLHFFYTIDYYFIDLYISGPIPYDTVTLPTNKEYLEVSYTFTNLTTDTVYKAQVSAGTYSKITNRLVYGVASERKDIYIQTKCEKERGFLRYSTGEFDVGMLVGLCCASLAVVIIGSGFVVLSFRKCFRDSYYYLDDVPCSIPNNSLEWNLTSPNSEHKGAIIISIFAAHVAELHADGDIGFSKEYEAIQFNKFNFTSDHSKSEENRAKNRYLNIIAYDHTRVHLLFMPGLKRNIDYINANYIDGFQRSRAYIGTQGPLPSTFDCFWRMVWEQRVTIIVMITNLVERGRRKCDMYWPKEGTETYGVIQVTLVKEDVMATYTVRTLEIKHLRIKGKRIAPNKLVYQYHYTNWPDHGTPDHPLPVLDFVKKSASANPPNGGPIIVHCSAGVGRTGTYIVLDAMLQQIRTRNEVNIFGFLQHIRTQRNFLVQTEEQYIFIHDAILEAIQSGETNISSQEMTTYVNSLQTNTDDSQVDQWRPLETQFKLLTSFQCQDFNLTSANKVINVPKNRDTIKPVESSRVHLTPKPGEDGSDYINATWIQGFNNLREFIITQHPLRTTIKDFWQMIWDHNAQMIVMISSIDNQDFEIYWPMDDEMIVTDSYKVRLTAECSYDFFVTRDFAMHSLQDDYELKVRMVQLTDWPHNTFVSEMMQLPRIIYEAKFGQHTGPVVVVDKFGGAEAATYCCLVTLREQLLYEDHADIYMFAKLYHNRRPGIWTLSEDFLKIHTAIEHFISSGEIHESYAERRYIMLNESINGSVQDRPRVPPEGMEAVVITIV